MLRSHYSLTIFPDVGFMITDKYTLVKLSMAIESTPNYEHEHLLLI